jgi:UDP-glucuronate decarboxylase
MNSPDDITGPINIGNPGEFTMLELARKVIALADSKSKLEFKPLPADDPKQRKPDITLARTRLNWQPAIELEEGLTRTLAYFKTLLKKD